ncbi:MAG: hypothetical protein J6N51_12145 [Selenomonas sp.]|nr:hypothetical protein [Selenomonas sp.]
MPMSESAKRADKKYKSTLSAFTIRVSANQMDLYKSAAAAKGMSFRRFVLSAIESAVEAESKDQIMR